MAKINDVIFIIVILLSVIYISGCSCCGSGCDSQKAESCFPAGTKITLADGAYKPIEDIKAGDMVLSMDKDRNLVKAEVIETEAPIRDGYYIIKLQNNEELKVTDEHPVYIKKDDYEGWGSIIPEKALEDAKIETEAIDEGDFVFTKDKEFLNITSIEHIKEQVQTYNLKTIKKTNTFFAEGILVHNKGDYYYNDNGQTDYN